MVDIVHHSIIGVGGALVAQQLGHVDIAVGFMVGSIIPDFDVVFMSMGKSTYLRMHQAVTHSIFVLPLIAWCIGTSFAGLFGANWVAVAAGCLFGGLVHVGFDALNSFGVRVLWPNQRRFALDAFFFIDIYVLLASSFALIGLIVGYNPIVVVVAWALFLVAYVSIKVGWRSKILKKTCALTVVPSGIFPLSYFLTREMDDGGIQIGNCSGFNRNVVWTDIYPAIDSDLLKRLQSGKQFSDLQKALKLFHPISIRTEGSSMKVISRCLAVRNFNNRYGEITSTFIDGELVDEKALL